LHQALNIKSAALWATTAERAGQMQFLRTAAKQPQSVLWLEADPLKLHIDIQAMLRMQKPPRLPEFVALPVPDESDL